MSNEQNDQIFQAIKELHTQLNNGFVHVDKRFEAIDNRFGKVEKRLDEMDKKITNLQNSMDILARKNYENETEIDRMKKAISQE